jgi:hypothetical protein
MEMVNNSQRKQPGFAMRVTSKRGKRPASDATKKKRPAPYGIKKKRTPKPPKPWRPATVTRSARPLRHHVTLAMKVTRVTMKVPGTMTPRRKTIQKRTPTKEAPLVRKPVATLVRKP